MPTISTLRAETRSIAIAAPPGTVLGVVADPTTLPQWAPDFARAVRPDGDHWLVDSDGTELRITVRADHDHGTVDLLAAADERVGAFTRVLPNGEGSEYLFTLFFADDTPEPAVTRQMRIVGEELERVRALSERAAASAA